MAKVKLGAIAGQVSGSIGCYTWSHNRFGNYIRLRSIPVQPESALQLRRRADMSANSSAWAGLSANERMSWKIWAQNNPIVDRLGDKRILSGHMAYVMLCSRLDMLGVPNPDVPPITAAPNALTTLTISASAATQSTSLVFTPTPIGAANILYIWGAKTPTATINYVKNILRFVDTASLNQASPYATVYFANVLGTLSVGETLIARVALINGVNGQISTFQEARCQVAA